MNRELKIRKEVVNLIRQSAGIDGVYYEDAFDTTGVSSALYPSNSLYPSETLYPASEIAPPETFIKYPLVVFNLDNSVDDGECSEVYYMIVDGWDQSTTDVNLSEMMYNMDRGLNKAIINIPDDGDDIGLSFRIMIDNRLTIPTQDKRYKRRQYRYQIRLVERKV